MQPLPSEKNSCLLTLAESNLLAHVLDFLRDDIARLSVRIGRADSYAELDMLAESLRDRIRAHDGVSHFLEKARKSA